MTDFTVFDKALKFCWVKALCSTDDAPWKAEPISLLSSVGGTLIFEELASNVPKTNSDVLNQIIWNNQLI